MLKPKTRYKREAAEYNVQAGDIVELTLIGRFDGATVKTITGSKFLLPQGTRQIDPDVLMTKFEQKKGRHGIYE
jgi:hypothetical protein